MRTFQAAFLLSLGLSVNAYAEKAPKYSLSTSDIYGQYEELDTTCTDETGRPCIGAIVTKSGKNGASIELTEYEVTISLHAKKGRLVFSWENPDVGECDDIGCSNLLGLSGVIYPKKQAGKYVPTLKLFAKKEFPYPEEGQEEGEAVETERMRKKP